jgi:hypothetical protein
MAPSQSNFAFRQLQFSLELAQPSWSSSWSWSTRLNQRFAIGQLPHTKCICGISQWVNKSIWQTLAGRCHRIVNWDLKFRQESQQLTRNAFSHKMLVNSVCIPSFWLSPWRQCGRCERILRDLIYNLDLSVERTVEEVIRWMCLGFLKIAFSQKIEQWLFNNPYLRATFEKVHRRHFPVRSGPAMTNSCWEISSCGELRFQGSPNITEIGTSAFCRDMSLKSVCIPSSVEVIGQRCFSYCHLISTLIFETRSKLVRIESWAFGYCSSLPWHTDCAFELLKKRPIWFRKREIAEVDKYKLATKTGTVLSFRCERYV